MMEGLRRFFRTKAGQGVALGGALLGVVLAIYSARANFGQSEAEAMTENRTYVCAETGKPFPHKLQRRETLPVYSPHSGKNTGYPAEQCYWTKDGKTKTEPTWVLLNMTVGKPGQTFCPDCGRLVRPYNPYPAPGSKPPPTKDEYEKNRGAAGAGPER